MLKFLERNKLRLVYLPLIIYWIVLFVATSIPGEELPSLDISDKMIHVAAYFILAVLLNFTLLLQNKYPYAKLRAYYLTIIIGVVYGALDELHQMFIPGRFAEFLDWIANVVGVLLGVFVVKMIVKQSIKSL